MDYSSTLARAERNLDFEEVLSDLVSCAVASSDIDMRALRADITTRLLNNQLTDEQRTEYYDARHTLDFYISDEEKHRRRVANGIYAEDYT